MKKVLALAAAMMVSQPLAAAEPVQGRWVTAEKDAVITIAPCGAKLCGRIAEFLVPPPQGLDQRDVNNRDPAKRMRKLLGMPVLTGFTQDSDQWRGEIYDPKSGKTYRSILRRKGSNVLEVKGCIGPFCQTQVWRKAG
ncbi:DUF2147 domain-containing protein [Qipengyuania zhejiangensis]|uniref:DUF2147 domain-containing protein n=1 Tax=Qipengyuania zhejiangensis TaxID=3077782 RepID=UPI002D76C816|nr:DUF2147 domain-containing protein [Qipengyuania sp. Z2]